mgnify:CR=1 FL=1
MRALDCGGYAKLWFDLSSNHTPSPGAELRQGEGLCSPVQGRRECETVRRQIAQKGVSLMV